MRALIWTTRAALALALGALPPSAQAQAGGDWAAAAAVEGYFYSIRTGDWPAAARVVSPEALDTVKARLWRDWRDDERLRIPGLAAALSSEEAYGKLHSEEVFVHLLTALDAAAPEQTAGIEDARITDMRPRGDGWSDVRVEVTRRDDRGGSVKRNVTVRARREGVVWRIIPPTDLPRDVAKAQRSW